jgi:hypothetical protein
VRIEFIRIMAWALFFVPSLLIVQPAKAATPTIANGETKTGTVTARVTGPTTGAGIDSYTLNVPAGGGSFVLSVAESGAHDNGFTPQLDIFTPDGTWGPTHGQLIYARLEQDNAAAGDWIVKVSRADSHNTGGGYSLKLIQVPGATGTAMNSGQDYSGSNTRGGIDVYTFSGTAGHAATVTLTKTGDNGFLPEAAVFTPSGGSAGSISCPTSCSEGVAIGAAGTYTLLVWKNDIRDVTGTYKVSVRGN